MLAMLLYLFILVLPHGVITPDRFSRGTGGVVVGGLQAALSGYCKKEAVFLSQWYSQGQDRQSHNVPVPNNCCGTL